MSKFLDEPKINDFEIIIKQKGLLTILCKQEGTTISAEINPRNE